MVIQWNTFNGHNQRIKSCHYNYTVVASVEGFLCAQTIYTVQSITRVPGLYIIITQLAFLQE